MTQPTSQYKDSAEKLVDALIEAAGTDAVNIHCNAPTRESTKELWEAHKAVLAALRSVATPSLEEAPSGNHTLTAGSTMPRLNRRSTDRDNSGESSAKEEWRAAAAARRDDTRLGRSRD